MTQPRTHCTAHASAVAVPPWMLFARRVVWRECGRGRDQAAMLSPPCKSFSGCMPAARAGEAHYGRGPV